MVMMVPSAVVYSLQRLRCREGLCGFYLCDCGGATARQAEPCGLQEVLPETPWIWVMSRSSWEGRLFLLGMNSLCCS